MTNNTKSWRDVLPVHPAADLFPLMSESELKELAEDIRKNGLQTQIVLWFEKNGSPSYLLDGRNRLDALALLGWLLPTSRKAGDPFKISPDSGIGLGGFPRISRLQAITKHCSGDPYAIALALNVHRRHLTADQKRELIEKLLKAKPDASDRAIAKQTKVDHKTVGKARAELEGRGEIPHVEKRTDTKGREQPSAKPKKTTALLNGNPIDVSKLGPKAQAAIEAQTGEVDIEARKAQMAELDNGQARHRKHISLSKLRLLKMLSAWSG